MEDLESQPHMPHVVVLGKRDSSRAYEFGLGKRSNQYPILFYDPMYGFGLGKRNQQVL